MGEDALQETYRVLLDECYRKQIELGMAVVDVERGLCGVGDYAFSSLSKYIQKTAELNSVLEKLKRMEQANKTHL
jgi:hypothetical protein